jgi:hypothetical protein
MLGTDHVAVVVRSDGGTIVNFTDDVPVVLYG